MTRRLNWRRLNWYDANACARLAIESITYVHLTSEWIRVNESGTVELWARTVDDMEIGTTFGFSFSGILLSHAYTFLGIESRPFAGLVFKYVDVGNGDTKKTSKSEEISS